MGERGPKPDAEQAAKGFPGRRKGKAQKAAGDAAKLAELLAPAPSGAVDLPPMLRDAKYEPAARVWQRLAPELRRTHRLPAESEFAFVQFCVYAQEWVATTEDLHINGFSQNIATVAGGKMERRRPKTLDRQQAYANCMELSARFGLTPNDMYALFKGQAVAAMSNPGLFDDGRGQQQAPQAPAPEESPGLVGSLARFRSPPPADRPN